MSKPLDKLKKEVPYKWRVQSYSKHSATASCVAYIDARDVMEILDEAVGCESWQDDYRDVGGQLFAGIGIKVDDEWIWKWDVGSESNIEKEKGLISDSFKRAAVKWGVGRFLYELEIKRVTTDGALTDSHKYPSVIDDNGKKVWDLTNHINSLKTKQELPTNDIPDGVRIVEVLEVFNGVSKAGNPFQKVKTGDGVAWNNDKNGLQMETGKTYEVVVQKGSIQQATEESGYDQGDFGDLTNL